jgi:magnesium chelatase subunit I
VLAHLLRSATADVFRARCSGLDLSGFLALVADGEVVETGELVPAAEVLSQVGTVPGLAKVLDRLGLSDAPSPGHAAAAIELVLEGLHLTRRLSKESTPDGRSVYGGR